MTEDQVREEIMNLDGSKATPIGDISVGILKSAAGIHFPFITNSINYKSEKVVLLKNLSLLKLAESSKKR